MMIIFAGGGGMLPKFNATITVPCPNVIRAMAQKGH